MRKWQRKEVLSIGTKVKFVSNASREWLVWRKLDPDTVFTVLENKHDYHGFCDVVLSSDEGEIINITNGSTISEGGVVIT